MSTWITYIVLTVLHICIVDVVALECYECVDTASPTSCNTNRNCTDDQACFVQSKSSASGVTFDMGCRDNLKCGVQSGSNVLIGRSVTTRRQAETCLECCSTDRCNAHLCQHEKPSTCVDDPTYDCANINSLFQICQNIHQAQKVCSKFCNLCSVDGKWSSWSTWSSCDVTCENGTQTRARTCTNPAPAYGGLNCSGIGEENKECVNDVCPVDGGWSLWTSWGTCSVSCGVGLQRRNRTCSSPYPSQHGNHCFGDARDDRVCFEKPCADGGWSDWGAWETCSAVCGGGLTRRYRQCDNPRPSTFGHACLGSAEQTNICNTGQCIYADCYDIQQHNKAATSGTYKVQPRGLNGTLLVYCDMDTDGGGWTVFQRRINGDVEFNRTFDEYEMGFGNANKEFWLGLQYIQQMTAVAPSELRIDLTAADGSTAYEVFKNFNLDAGPAYTLHIDHGTGIAGDSGVGLSFQNGQDFYTEDHDNQHGCAVSNHGGWWYNFCAAANLNGDYGVPGTVSQYGGGQGGVVYYNFKGSYESLKHAQMMFRKI